MPLQTIDIGTGPNTQTGDDARTWAQKSNANFNYLESLIQLKSKSIENRYVTPPNNTYTYMLTDQANQTLGKIQFVDDASAWPLETLTGSAYFEYLGTTNGNETDYGLMTPEEVAAVLTKFNTFKLKEIDVAPAEKVTSGRISIQYENVGNKVTHLLFNKTYSEYIEKGYDVFKTTRNYDIAIIDHRYESISIVKVTGFATPTAGYYKVAIENTIDVSLFTLNDDIEILWYPTPVSVGGGDMLAATYDPNTVAGDAFAMDNMVEGATTKILTDTERSEISANTAKISYTDAAAVSANTAKVGVTTQISNVVEDTTPQLGGNLDLNGNVITGLEIGTDVQAHSSVLDATTASFTTADETKLDAIEALADVTDATNVDAAGATMNTDFNANTILAATTDDTPVALTVGEETFVGRVTGGNITALTKTQVHTFIQDRMLVDATVITTQDLDYSLYDSFNFIVTGAVTFTESNLPTSGTNGKVIIINVTGNFAITYPSGWNTSITGTYDGTVQNTIVVWYISTGVYKVQITQPD